MALFLPLPLHLFHQWIITTSIDRVIPLLHHVGYTIWLAVLSHDPQPDLETECDALLQKKKQ